MRLTRIHVSDGLAADTEMALPRGPSEHLLRVLRLRAGSPLTLFDGRGGEYAAVLLSEQRGAAKVRIGEHLAVERESPLDVTLLQALVRGERMDLIVQKATELGVRRIVPILAERSVVRLDAAQAQRRLAHWQAVAVSACEQCGRNRLPEFGALTPLLGIGTADGRARLLLDPDGDHTLAGAIAGHAAVSVLIGPEGGLSEPESQALRQWGFRACRLGPRVLRTETAPLAALAALQLLAGDLNR